MSNVSAPRIAPRSIRKHGSRVGFKMFPRRATLALPLVSNEYYMAVVLAGMKEEVEDSSVRVMSLLTI